jgi:hypothetical protein
MFNKDILKPDWDSCKCHLEVFKSLYCNNFGNRKFRRHNQFNRGGKR